MRGRCYTFRSYVLGVLFLSCAAVSFAFAEGPDLSLLSDLAARPIGPATMSGRIGAIDVVQGRPEVFYVGAATGGLWKTVDGGVTFKPIFEKQDVHSIGAVAIFQKSPEIVWVGTGEGNPRNSASVGKGVFRSLDGGRTWKHLGLDGTEKIHRICLDPENPDIAYVAALGSTWGDSETRGVYKTEDGGDSWQKILYVNERTGCADLVMDPSNPRKLIAALWEHRREPWFFKSGGPGSGIHMTRDGGETWTPVKNGIPGGELGRIGLAMAPSDPQVVYAYVEAKGKNAICRSDDGGETWRVTSRGQNIGNRPFYYADLRVDTKNPDRVYSLWSLVSVSEDGGKNFRVLVPFREVHPDHHELWIHPERPEFLINGNDGGVAISHDYGKTWRYVRNLPLAQFYHVHVDLEVPYNIYGGLQDNGSWKGPSSVWENGGIRNFHWRELNFGDGFDTVPHPKDPDIGYAMSQEGFLVRYNVRTGEQKSIRPAGPADTTLRFNWNAAIAIDPHEPDTVYFGSQFVHRSKNRGDRWETISGDLTTDNPEWQKQNESGGLTPDVTGAENFVSLVTIAPSPVKKGLIWAGSDDGRIHVTSDAGGTWTSVEDRLEGVPDNTWVTQIVPSRFDADTAYVILDDHRRANWTPYVFRTDDRGVSFQSLGSDEISGYCLALAEDLLDKDLLYLGTEFGLHISFDGGRSWTRWDHGVPHCSVMDLQVHPREHDLVVATHGRAVFVIDNLRPLSFLTKEKLEEPLSLYPVRSAQQHWIQQTGSSRFPGHGEFRGKNPPYGALINYSLHRPEEKTKGDDAPAKGDGTASGRRDSDGDEDSGGDDSGSDAPDRDEKAEKKKKAKVEIEIHDAAGNLVRTFNGTTKHGMNRVVWNLRRWGYRRPGQDRNKEPQGPQVVPGSYEVTVRYGDHVAKEKFEVLADPRLSISIEERLSKNSAILELGKLTNVVADALDQIKAVRQDIKRVEQKAKSATEREDGRVPLMDEIKELRKGLKKIAERLRAPEGRKGIQSSETVLSKIRGASWMLGSSWEAPTQDQLARAARAREFAIEVLGELNEFLAEELPQFRARVQAAGLQLFPDPEPITVPGERRQF